MGNHTFRNMQTVLKNVILSTQSFILLLSCGPIQEGGVLSSPDIKPPVLTQTSVTDCCTVCLRFDEPALLQEETLAIAPELSVTGISAAETCVTIATGDQRPGIRYSIQASAVDDRGNSTSFVAAFYGFNSSIPQVLINEFTTQGSSRHPDMVELAVQSDGNMAGLSLYQGTPGTWTDRLVFPSFEVAAGDFIVVHFRPQGTPEEVDEILAKDASGGLDATDTAYDFWLPEGTGISGNNGVLSLYDSPNGTILDGVLYSNRTSSSDTKYGGFGRRSTLERADELVRDGGWRGSADRVRPEDAVNPESSTSTRSICRDNRSTDTDSKADWHIVPTRGATFGAPNSDEVYSP